eukprot:314162_1
MGTRKNSSSFLHATKKCEGVIFSFVSCFWGFLIFQFLLAAVYTQLLGHHHLDELLVVDLAVTVDVGLADHLVDLLVGELLAEVRHDVAELSSGDETVAVLVENAESLLDLLLGVGVLHLAGHQGQELGEINRAAAVLVDLVDHVLELSLSGVLAEGAHDGAELLGRDGAIAVLVEQGEGLLELADLLVGKLVGHGELISIKYRNCNFF